MLVHLISNTGEIMGTEVSRIEGEKQEVKFELVEDGNLTHALVKVENMNPVLFEVNSSTSGYMFRGDYVYLTFNFDIVIQRATKV